MLTRLESLFARENRSGQRGAELEGATPVADSATEPPTLALPVKEPR